VIDLSDDGTTLVFEEWGEGGGSNGAVYLRRFDGTPPVRLGEGVAIALSPDKQWVLTQSYTDPPRLVLLPTGAGQPRSLTAVSGLHYQQEGVFLPDGKRVVFAATEADHGRRLYVQSVEGATPRAFTADGAIGTAHGLAQSVSPDGKFVAALDSTDHARLFALDGSESRPVPGAEVHEEPLRWSADGRMLFVWKHEEAVFKVSRIVIASGKRELWKELHPDPAGMLPVNSSMVLTPDGKTYFYDSQRRLSELYLVDGLR
jgi:Tol biopolymer transport system component